MCFLDLFFFFNDTATTEIYTLSLHDALPICLGYLRLRKGSWNGGQVAPADWVEESTRPFTRVHEMNPPRRREGPRSEEHTSELQSRQYLVCRLLLEKKK